MLHGGRSPPFLAKNAGVLHSNDVERRPCVKPEFQNDAEDSRGSANEHVSGALRSGSSVASVLKPKHLPKASAGKLVGVKQRGVIV